MTFLNLIYLCLSLKLCLVKTKICKKKKHDLSI